MLCDLQHFGATKSAQDILVQHNLCRSESAQVKIGVNKLCCIWH